MDKYDNIIKECRDLVESLPPGATVPSVRRLMKRCGVSQLVITQAMNEMKKAGLIVSQVGRGTFKAPADNRENCPNGVVSLLLPDWQSSFTAAILTEFARHFTASGYTLKPCYHNYGIERVTPEMLPAESDALIVYWHWDFDLNTWEHLARLDYPVVLINSAPQGLGINAVSTDNELGGAMAAGHFLNNGHTKIGMMLTQPQLDSTVSRRNGFAKYLMVNGITPLIIDCNTRPGEQSSAHAYEKMMQLGRSGTFDCTALFCDSDLGALGVMRACHELELSVPNDLCIIGFDNIPECGFFHPALSSIDQNLGEWAVAAEKIIHACRNDPQVRRTGRQTLIAPSLVLRESTRRSAAGETVIPWKRPEGFPHGNIAAR